MKKDDLKSLVTQIHTELVGAIDAQNEPTKEQVIHYLRDAIITLQNINDDKTDSIEHAKLAFSNAYKEIAKQSISSYQESNETFEKLSKIHQEALDEFEPELIDVPAITTKFNDIQSHMTDEVKRANKIISTLTNQIKELEEDSNLDGLTKTFNRRALDRYLINVTKKENLKHNLNFLMLDIDDFKAINDTYGHVAGDKILIFIANTLHKTLRDGDKVFRYGGEEFVVILNRIDADRCVEIANRILHNISTNSLFYKGQSINVTMSIGATVYVDGDTPESLTERADKALYKSKALGKNQLNMEYLNGN